MLKNCLHTIRLIILLVMTSLIVSACDTTLSDVIKKDPSPLPTDVDPPKKDAIITHNTISIQPPSAPDSHTFSGTEVAAFHMQNTVEHADDSETPPNPFAFATNPLNVFHDTSQKYEPFFLSRNVDNPQNPNAGQDPEGEVSWDFDIAGVSNVKLFVDIAAKGDFEATDVFELTYQIDGGTERDALTFAVDESGKQTYELFNDDPTAPKQDVLFDPLTITDDTGTTTASNIFKTYTASLTGTGNSVKIRFKVVQEGGNEMVALKNLFVADATTP